MLSEVVVDKDVVLIVIGAIISTEILLWDKINNRIKFEFPKKNNYYIFSILWKKPHYVFDNNKNKI